jgi:hypothetical protein
MHNTSRCIGLLSLLMFSMHSLADISCPQMPSAVTSVNRDVRSEINASVGSLGKVKAGEVGSKTEVVAKNLFDKYPNVDKLLALQTMSATYCSMLRDSALKEGDKLDRWEKFQEKVLNLQPSAQPSGKATPSTHSKISRSIEGRWVIKATENTPKTYLNLKLWNGELTGNTKILYPWTRYQQTAIVDGKVIGNRITFVTERNYPDLSTPMKDFVHRYEGQIKGDKINFTVQLKGGAFEEVIARKLLRAQSPEGTFDWVDGEFTYRFDGKTFQTAKEACRYLVDEKGEEYLSFDKDGYFLKNKDWKDVKGWEDIGYEITENSNEVRCFVTYSDGRANIYTQYQVDSILTCPSNSVSYPGRGRCECDDEYIAKNGECAPALR